MSRKISEKEANHPRFKHIRFELASSGSTLFIRNHFFGTIVFTFDSQEKLIEFLGEHESRFLKIDVILEAITQGYKALNEEVDCFREQQK